MTPEEMQAEIVRLKEIETAHTTTIATMTEQATATTNRITELQEHNQKLFLKVTNPEGKKTEGTKQSVEDFAKTLKF